MMTWRKHTELCLLPLDDCWNQDRSILVSFDSKDFLCSLGRSALTRLKTPVLACPEMDSSSSELLFALLVKWNIHYCFRTQNRKHWILNRYFLKTPIHRLKWGALISWRMATLGGNYKTNKWIPGLLVSPPHPSHYLNAISWPAIERGKTHAYQLSRVIYLSVFRPCTASSSPVAWPLTLHWQPYNKTEV